jgi:hypothetical protein
MRRDILATTSVLLALVCAASFDPSGAEARDRKDKKAKSDSTAVQSTPAKQDSAAAKSTPPGTMTITEAKQILGITVAPAKDQTPQQQEQDEIACLRWGADQAGVKPGNDKDPKAAGQEAAAQVDSATKGVAVKGAAKGAAVGAIVGSFSGNAGSGAAWGAGGGAIAGIRAKNKASAKAQSQAEQKTKAENEAKREAVKKNMTACLEEKGYTVK